MTSKPSASSSARADALNASWSSTISTVGRTANIVPDTRSPTHRGWHQYAPDTRDGPNEPQRPEGGGREHPVHIPDARRSLHRAGPDVPRCHHPDRGGSDRDAGSGGDHPSAPTSGRTT